MGKRRWKRALLALALTAAASGWGFSTEWRPWTEGGNADEPGQPCGVFKFERRRAYFDRCKGPTPDWDERYGGGALPPPPSGQPR